MKDKKVNFRPYYRACMWVAEARASLESSLGNIARLIM